MEIVVELFSVCFYSSLTFVRTVSLSTNITYLMLDLASITKCGLDLHFICIQGTSEKTMPCYPYLPVGNNSLKCPKGFPFQICLWIWDLDSYKFHSRCTFLSFAEILIWGFLCFMHFTYISTSSCWSCPLSSYYMTFLPYELSTALAHWASPNIFLIY